MAETQSTLAHLEEMGERNVRSKVLVRQFLDEIDKMKEVRAASLEYQRRHQDKHRRADEMTTQIKEHLVK